MNKKLIFGIVLGIVLIYFSVRGIDFNETLSHLKKVDLGYAAVSLFFIILMQALRSYRWGVILQPMEKIDQLTLFSVTSVGFLAIVAIPARIGELARPFLISKKSSIKMSSAFGTIVVERVLDSLSVLTITIAVLILQDLPSWMIKSGILFFAITMLIIAFIIGLVWRREAAVKIIDHVLQLLPGRLSQKIMSVIHHFIDGFQVITDVKRLLYLFFLSMVVWVVDAAVIYSLFLAFGFDLPLLAAFVIMVILIAGIAIPTAPGFIGNWHYACILGLGLFGIAKPEAFSFALVYHFISMIVVVVLGVSFLPFNKFSLSDLTGQMGEDQGARIKEQG
ncbi:MAG TPA: lysylphosphatidylglycerol synthase transmembrane domain-containing protein [Smithellaceae bacterium]|jgi:glycosyltransferase 2 family protein|nr:lysylphosphatidylglycerol synthase transmembrane domain-containing protein [Smithellaceae bacterium]HOG80845.1 lysylphosphatidylglycerol synthase transmembrane domain-containing protein [Smithellaceae bacterium]HOQ42041.1 lysylphosphatidylglycerol synthase transmembrane domain-containing protein [Smithellaceae bacterium]HPL65242.1 lysylphosphatidylglycerol synthase transmembrane domain-containing protein [Smithellaceae bacterium]HQP23573.1 lysylphosphatidylglycerol synthase transmembrane dom